MARFLRRGLALALSVVAVAVALASGRDRGHALDGAEQVDPGAAAQYGVGAAILSDESAWSVPLGPLPTRGGGVMPERAARAWRSPPARPALYTAGDASIAGWTPSEEGPAAITHATPPGDPRSAIRFDAHGRPARLYRSQVGGAVTAWNDRMPMGSIRYLAYSLYLPATFPAPTPDASWMVFSTWPFTQNTPDYRGDGRCSLHLRPHAGARDGVFQITYSPAGGWQQPVVKGRWLDFIFGVKLLDSPSRGWLDVWYREHGRAWRHVIDRLPYNPISHHAGPRVLNLYGKLGLYFGAGGSYGAHAATYVYFRDIRVGSALDQVKAP